MRARIRLHLELERAARDQVRVTQPALAELDAVQQHAADAAVLAGLVVRDDREDRR